MALMDAMGSVVYAARLADGTIKIGWTEHFGDRLRSLKSYVGQDVELIGFRFGDRDDEQAIHASLTAHVHHGREYYNPAPEVLAVVNEMRESLNMPQLAA